MFVKFRELTNQYKVKKGIVLKVFFFCLPFPGGFHSLSRFERTQLNYESFC